ncbi:helix-turn-helix domain-containing protein [Teredinibacter turnerae]|uniref:helix-turn-helix domain-containing protein n=1 Tax=Teredinibacter turnerae TaxID=2426 RepID=UPI000567F7FF|nr:helix-turn-helix domain-containing protein [Teredinibacter turnerae]
MTEALQNHGYQGVVGAGPVVTKRLFAQLTGLTEETIRGMIERGHLPTVKIGKHRMVNVALITKDALETEFEQ